ncbi:MAG: 1-deoxy-D-xylulose-5-phosphate synthase [Bacillota bacterium]|nr:1-deoxy-D-xylulose-5-phosphate synthase [Bacillota bacterium]
MYLDKNSDLIKQVKNLSYKELDNLAVEIREFLLNNVSKTGGHLASNLGAVELTIALQKVFDTTKDRIVFDVGHQSYVHKIITGRKDQFYSLRQHDGLSGFPKRTESIHDAFDSGHSGTSISAAFGYAKARDLKGEDYQCVAVIGDGALTGGVAYEALNAAGDSNTPLIVILNDNEMSINSSTGGMASHLHRLRTSNGYQKFKNGLKGLVKNTPNAYKYLKNIRDMIKSAIIPAGIFEELGFKYFGPIDGHNIKEMVDTLNLAKELKRPVLIHVITKKGKGFIPAEQNPAKYHGIGSFDLSTANSKIQANHESYSDIFGRKLLSLAHSNEKICAISAAMIDATGLNYMQSTYPERVFDAGIAEQHAISFAAGLALNGMRPVVAIYSTFLQRAYDQIVTEVALQNLPVIFAIDRAGVTGRDGETHQGMFDIAFLNAIPNLTILAPKDGPELETMLEYAFTINGPVAIRYPRENSVNLPNTNAEIPQPEILISGNKNAIIAIGSMVREALDAANELGNIDLINLRQIKPIHTEFLSTLKYKKIIVVEDGCLSGGIGEAISNYFAELENAPLVKCLTWPDKFIEHGSISELRNIYKLDSEGIKIACEDYFEK